MKLTKRRLRRIITEEFLQLEQFDTGSAGDEVGGTTLEQKKEQCEKAGGEWVSDDPSGKYGHCSVQIKEQRDPRFDDDYDPLNPSDEFAPPTPEEDAEYNRGYDDGFNGYPQAEDGGLGYYAGYEEGENDAKDPDSEASREHAEEFGPGSPGMMGPRREGKITRLQLRRIIREEQKSTKKYDDDSALTGDQDELPDALQKGIIDKVSGERKKKNESRKLTRQQLKRMIREETEQAAPFGSGMEMADTDPEEKELVGHTWLTHAKLKSSALQESYGIQREHVGKVVYHSLQQDGTITHYDISFNGQVLKNVAAHLVESVVEQKHEHAESGEK